ncbi:MAG: mannose-1-phosphate guanylyltransferase [Pirellulales bacterium]
MLHAVIMAGGSGTRFWPASRATRPKQLLNLAGDRSMIQMTVDRLGDLVSPQRTLIVTNERLVDAIGQQLPDLPADAILGEPCKRDTAPCIGLAALQVLREDPDATMVVLPADHVIRPERSFRDAIRLAAELVDQEPRRLVTFGISPSYPAEIFGYIQRGKPLDRPGVYRVKQFREKPDLATAKEYVESGSFYWNAGIFVWRAATILRELEEHAPRMVEHLRQIDQACGTPAYQQTFEEEFAAIDGISIDFAVMERAEEVVVVEAPFQWDDVGSWLSLARLRGTDEAGNTIVGRHLGLNTRETIVQGSDDHLIVTVGLSDLLVVHTPQATLVANKQDEESVRRVVELLRERGWEEYL